MSLRILGVHGVWNHRPHLSEQEAAEVLGREWFAALEPQLPAHAAVDLRVAYFAQHLNRVARQGDGDGLDDLPAAAVEWLVHWAEQLEVLPSDIPQARWSIPARYLADRIADSFQLNRMLVRPFVATCLREVHAYFGSGDLTARHATRACVADLIRRHRPHVLLAHSLGSVVAYETLWCNPDLYVNTLMTMGSPLGMRHVIFDRLEPEPGLSHKNRPPNIARWINIADPGDIVAIPRPFTKRFRTDENWEDSHIHRLDFHTVKRYLASDRTTAALGRLLAQPGD